MGVWNLPDNATEHEEQRDFIRWMRQNHPTIRVYAIPNGGHRHKGTAAKLKLEGVTKGVPDLHIPALHLWIEMKTKKNGRVSPDQKDWIEYLNQYCGTAVVCRGSLEAQRVVSEILQASSA